LSTPNGFTLDNSGRRVVVDPVTRIEGHMRCEVNIDSNNVIRNAVSTGTMWRGLEVILKGRDPRDAWAFVERICGVCTGTHALTGVRGRRRAQDQDSENANSIRNIMQLALQVHDHLVHFYHLHALDWVDRSTRSPIPRPASCSSAWRPSIPLSSPGYFRDVQNRLKKFVESGQLGPFKNGYWGNPAYKLPPEANLMAVTLPEALDFQKEIVRSHHLWRQEPAPELAGRRRALRHQHRRGRGGGAPINMEPLTRDLDHRALHRIHRERLHPDVIAIAGSTRAGSMAAACRASRAVLRRHPGQGQRL
jgi:hydrogenase large subunit